MTVQPLHTNDAPKAIGPYSQAVVVGNLVFTSGQIALDPASGAMVDGGVEAQTERVFENLIAVLTAADVQLTNVAKVHVYLADMNDFPKVNEIYARVFGDHKPARSTVEVARLPKDALIEIDMIAHK